MLPSIVAGIASIERGLTRLMADVKKTEAQLSKEVDDLERETSPSHVIQATTVGEGQGVGGGREEPVCVVIG